MRRLVFLFAVVLALAGCQNSTPQSQVSGQRQIQPPEWSYNKSIYEVNLRQYSPEGTFRSFAEDLPRLKNLGVEIIWLMPIHPIGELNRKGTLGSYYSVKDYKAVNPEFGSADDFRQLVEQIHGLGMYVILDWVANHTAWDNPLTESHPEWFTRDSHGNFVPPVPDWSDVIDLNYENRELWSYMIGALKYWVEEFDIDGFRCDVADMVPLAFWEQARRELDSVKPVFMLAEAETIELHEKAFDMTYSWELHHLMNDVAQGRKTVHDLDAALQRERRRFARSDFRMRFTSNHDENSWNGTALERLGDAAATFAVFSATIEGMPLLYNGQEAGLNKRLAFFDKDPIDWREHPFEEMYRTLFRLKAGNKALWNGNRGGEMERLSTNHDRAIFAFAREQEGDKVLVVLNFSATTQQVRIISNRLAGDYREAFTGEPISLASELTLELGPWAYRVYVR